jgi:YesN/AraC family two-component response regulator
LPARILIADDNSIARTAIRALIDWHSFQVCGEAKHGKEAIEKVIELKPDVILLDINMPVMNGVAAAYEIRRIAPATKIVFLSIHDTPTVVQGVRIWAHGFVGKSATGTELIPMLHRLVGVPGEKPTRKPAKSKSGRASAED